MKLLDILNAPWAIQRDKLREIQAIYASHVRGEKIDIEAVEKRIGRPLVNDAPAYEVIDGVAVLGVSGVMARRMNLFSQISGGMSTQLATRDLQQAVADDAVHAIIQMYDTPGGTVDGTPSFAAAIAAADQVKPVVALVEGTMASAGYWAGSAARGIYISESTSVVGSIGVVAEHVDVSRADEAQGIKRTEIVAGKYKRIASSNGPLTAEGLQTIQDQVDYTYSLFVQAVATQRGVSVDTVLADMADGRIFIGEQAINAGLVDGVSTLAGLVDMLNRDRSGAGVAQRRAPTAAAEPGRVLVSLPAITPNASTGADPMPITREQLAAEAPDVLAAVLAEGAQQGAATERARIQAVEAAALPGYEAVIAALKFDGKSTGGDAALAVIAADRAARNANAAALAAEAPPAVPQAAANPMPAAAGAEDESAPIDERAKATWEADASVRAEFGNLAAYTAFRRAQASGKVRILGAKRA